MQTLTRKIPISKPLSTDWKTFNKLTKNVLYDATRIMNDVMTMIYEHEQEKRRYREQVGKSMNVKEVYGATYPTIINRELKSRYKKSSISGDLLERIVRQALDTWKTHKKEVMSASASLPTFRRDQPIPIRSRKLKLTQDNTVNLNLLTKEIADNNGFKGRNKQSINVQLKTDKQSQIIIDRILNDEYKLADSQLQRNFKGDYYLLLSYHQPIKEIEYDENKIMGIDLGINKAVVMAIKNEQKIYEIDGGEIQAFRRKTNARRKSLQNQLRVCSKNRRGHGKKTLLKPLDKLAHKVENFKNLTNHRYSKHIIDTAIKHGVGHIQLEDLTHINKNNNFLKTWSYFDLQNKIEYKANQNNITVTKVKPNYTSQRCFKCGVIDKDNRRNQQVFKCTTCNHKRNADYNAAENLTIKNIESVIKDQLKAQSKIQS